MVLVVGLGNPGRKYANTRHNVGFAVADALAKELAADPWRFDESSEAEITEAKRSGDRILIVKPQTFMNLSGSSVARVARHYRVAPEHVFVVSDDADLPLGALRIRVSGSSGGHRGIQSIIDAFGTDQFSRFRVGVSTPDRSARVVDAKDFVLSVFTPEEKSTVDDAVRRTVSSVVDALETGIDTAMSRWNRA